MSTYKNENTKVIGFFGQSGSGKTTIIKSLPHSVNGIPVKSDTGVIRRLFAKNPTAYRNPGEFIEQKYQIMNEGNPGSIIAQMYEKYIRSQFQLLNDFSTEVFLEVREGSPNKSFMLFDRCPMDFHTLTECGVAHLMSVYGGKMNKTHNLFLNLAKKTAIENTIKFFDAIFIVKPWTEPNHSNINVFNDGIRDQYLSEYYVGKNWYDRLDGIDLGSTKVFFIDENQVSIDSRVKLVVEKMKEI